MGASNLCQHFEISYSSNAFEHITISVNITINDNYSRTNIWRSQSKILEYLCIKRMLFKTVNSIRKEHSLN